VIRHRILEAETAEPRLGQIEVHLVTQPALRVDAELVGRGVSLQVVKRLGL
jgi:hypothetical protein